MKKCLFLVVLALWGLAAAAQESEPQMYLEEGQLPDAVYWLPAPPAPGSTQFLYDISQYFWGKDRRLDPARAEKAVREAVYAVDPMLEQFSVAFGLEVSPQKTPAIYNVVNRAVHTIRLSATKPKATYMRTRPYAYFDEPTLVPKDEADLRTNGSYPSGHTVRGWGMALLFCEINPEAQDELFKLGYEWGQSRVIAGFHWQSDVDAARLLASAAYARLHACPEFLDDMAAARKEFRRLKAR